MILFLVMNKDVERLRPTEEYFIKHGASFEKIQVDLKIIGKINSRYEICPYVCNNRSDLIRCSQGT